MKILNRQDYDTYVPMVPYMPENPRVGYGYVPYQINPRYFNNLTEAFVQGTLYPDLVTPYLEYVHEEV
ncbi:MAG: spore coat associated protein CotJA [Sedimentibacter sp.]|uniref:spore coat associated protein CotJA n=1 Tax=Sedimentibacter sp. TaxID=1960295 RepID=UPI003158D2A9